MLSDAMVLAKVGNHLRALRLAYSEAKEMVEGIVKNMIPIR